MRKTVVRNYGLALTLLLTPAVAFAAEPERDGIWILNDVAAAQKEARSTKKPIFVVFRCER